MTNFLKLCKIKYYNDCLIFKVQKDYIAQTGDKKNNGSGGHSIYSKLPGLAQRYFADEIHPKLKQVALNKSRFLFVVRGYSSVCLVL